MRLEPVADIGRTDSDQSGLPRFKRQFASREWPLTTLRWSPDDIEPQGARDEADPLTALTELLTSPAVPNGVTARGGPLLYRYFG